MLAEQGRPEAGLGRAAAEVGRGGEHGQAALLVGNLDHGAGGVELLVGHDVVDRVDRAPEHLGLFVEGGPPFVQGPGGEDLVEQADQLGRVPPPGARVFEALVVQPLGVSDDARQGRPVAVALEAHDPKGAPVAGHVVVQGRAVHRLARADAQAPAPHQRDVDIEADGVDALAQQRSRDHLAHARCGRARPAPRSPWPPRSWPRCGRPCRRAGTATAPRARAGTRRCPSGPRRRRCRTRRARRRGPRSRSR